MEVVHAVTWAHMVKLYETWGDASFCVSLLKHQATKRLTKHSSVKDLHSEISSLGQTEMVGKSLFSYPASVAELKDWIKFTNSKQIQVFWCSGLVL